MGAFGEGGFGATTGPSAGLARVALAGVLFPVLARAPTDAGPTAFLAAGLALVFGGLLAAGRPRALARSPLATVALDALLVGLLVAGTGGAGSPFFPLYFLAALGLLAVRDRARTAAGVAATVGAYPVAVVLADGLGALGSVPVGLRAGSLAIFCAAVVCLRSEARDFAGHGRALSSSLAAERDRAARAEALIPGFGATLRTLSLEEILSWTVRTAHAGCGGTYAHVALPEGNHHVSLLVGETDACPSWWHPVIQGLVLRVRREGAGVRDGAEVHGTRGFMAAPLGPEGGARGVVIVGGGEFGPGAERVLALICSAVGPVLAGAGEAPGGRDAVTGLPNRASLRRVLRQELPRGRSLTVFAAEVGDPGRRDRARGFAADDLVRRIGARLAKGRRVYRNGDEGFFVLLSGADETRARRAALAILRAISEEAGDLARPAVGYASAGEWTGDPELVLQEAVRAAAEARDGADRVAGSAAGTGGPGVVEALLGALEVKDPGIGAHLREVARISRDIARAMGVPGEQIEALEAGALLHDVGKIGIPDQILHKPGRLTCEEYEIIKRHPALGARIIAPVRELGPALPVVSHHHERFDGRGYPDGLRGEGIPIAARIVAAADAYDSMVRERPYGYEVPHETALREIEANSGSQFDPAVVRALRASLGEHRADENRSFG